MMESVNPLALPAPVICLWLELGLGLGADEVKHYTHSYTTNTTNECLLYGQQVATEAASSREHYHG